MTNGLSVSDITPLGERPADIWRGRTGTSIAGVDSLGGTALGALPTTTGDLFVYDAATDTWVIVNDSTFGVPLTVEDEGTPLATAADTLNFVGAGVTATGSGGTKTVTIPGSAGALGWFNVKDYGALGNGTTDDTAAINLAIAALIAAGRGVLYFPAGTYKVTAGLTTISVPCLILGDGGVSSAGPVSLINCTSATASLFTVSSNGVTFRGLTLNNTAATPSAGAAITSTGGQFARFEDLVIGSFYTNIDLENSAFWSMTNCYIGNATKYGFRIRNTSTPDEGDWAISNSIFSSSIAADSAIRIESSGGGKITNCKVNGGTGTSNYVKGIDLAIGTGVSTSDLLLANNSIENVSGDAVSLVTTSTGAYTAVIIRGLEVSVLGNTGRAINADGAGLSYIDFDGVYAATAGTARAAVALTNCNIVVVNAVMLAGNFTSTYTNSGATNVVDNTGAIAGVRVTGTPTSGQVPIATGGTAAVWASRELDYVQITSGVACTATTEGTANTVITGSSVAYDGATVVYVEAWFPYIATPASTGVTVSAWLYDGSSSIGRLYVSIDPAAGAMFNGGVFMSRRLTPSNASHTYSIRGSTSSGSASFVAGAGGVGNDMPAYIRVVRAV